jgi:hypothetical protein
MAGFRISSGVVSCFLLLVPQAAIAQDGPLRQVIDLEIGKSWQKNKIEPAKRSSDSLFLRRIYLDLAGVTPSYEETTQFLQESDPRKREKLIDRLLDDPRFGAQQAHVWDLILFGRRPQNGEALGKRIGFKKWLAERFARNEPYDRIVQQLLQAEEDGTQLFYVQYRNQPEEATTAVTRVFLGTQLQCARCHDHPFENWTQRDFYGMAGFFVRLVVVDAGGSKGEKKYRIGEKSTGEVLFAGSVKDAKPGQKGEPVKPKFLGGLELQEPAVPKGFKDPDFKGNAAPPKPLFSRKEKFVDWLTARQNPYFARAAANRIWAQFMGRGFVHPVDDLSEKNEPSYPALLKAIASGLVWHKFDMKWLIREIVNSEAYQLSDTGSVAEALPVQYERARVRPLSAEELIASLGVATGNGVDWAAKSQDATSEYMLRFFGEPNDGQGHFQGSLAEHLFLNNSGSIRRLGQARKGNLADALLTSKQPWPARVDRLFLSILSRTPTAAERDRFVKHLSSDAKMAPALVEEAIWVLLSCSEFRFNH